MKIAVAVTRLSINATTEVDAHGNDGAGIHFQALNELPDDTNQLLIGCFGIGKFKGDPFIDPNRAFLKIEQPDIDMVTSHIHSQEIAGRCHQSKYAGPSPPGAVYLSLLCQQSILYQFIHQGGGFGNTDP